MERATVVWAYIIGADSFFFTALSSAHVIYWLASVPPARPLDLAAGLRRQESNGRGHMKTTQPATQTCSSPLAQILPRNSNSCLVCSRSPHRGSLPVLYRQPDESRARRLASASSIAIAVFRWFSLPGKKAWKTLPVSASAMRGRWGAFIGQLPRHGKPPLHRDLYTAVFLNRDKANRPTSDARERRAQPDQCTSTSSSCPSKPMPVPNAAADRLLRNPLTSAPKTTGSSTSPPAWCYMDQRTILSPPAADPQGRHRKGPRNHG